MARPAPAKVSAWAACTEWTRKARKRKATTQVAAPHRPANERRASILPVFELCFFGGKAARKTIHQ